MKKYVSIVTLLLATLVVSRIQAGDWPQYRANGGRTSESSDALPAKLGLTWTRELPKPITAWPAPQVDVHFDTSYMLVVLEKTLFISSMVRDSLTAYDTETGKEKWRFYAKAPIRFAPVAWNNKVAFGSDDGILYCLDATTGKQLWNFMGAPDHRQVIGNHRLSSVWPIRTGPALCNDTIYFSAGLWPFMGIFIYAIDAKTGNITWETSSYGDMWIRQPKVSSAFGALAPQGYIAASETSLIVPNGRARPACFDIKTGAMRFFNLSKRIRNGGWSTMITGNQFGFGKSGFSHNVSIPDDPNTKPTTHWSNLPGGPPKSSSKKKGKKSNVPTSSTSPEIFLVKAGNTRYGHSGTTIVDSNSKTIGTVDSPVWDMAAADGKLFVSTESGKIYCFGTPNKKPITHSLNTSPVKPVSDEWTKKTAKILAGCSESTGYCIVLGLGSGRLIQELITQSKFDIIVIDPDEAKIKQFRKTMDEANLYGRKISAQTGNPLNCGLPQYMAHLIVSETFDSAALKKNPTVKKSLFRPLRPYGGIAYLGIAETDSSALVKLLTDAKLDNSEIKATEGFVTLKRVGALKGSAPWNTHYADTGNSQTSKDKLVKLPLGLLWYGGPSHESILPRHGHGPSPQVAGGRLIIEGIGFLRAVDVYTGRLIWQRDIKDVGLPYNHEGHHAGAGEIGSNYVTMADSIYVITPEILQVLDPATGKTIRTFEPPKGYAPGKWGWITANKDFLLVTHTPLDFPYFQRPRGKRGKNMKRPDPEPLPEENNGNIQSIATPSPYATSSKSLIMMDRKSGKVLWTRNATHAFRHNAIIIADSKVFVMDSISPKKIDEFQWRGGKLSKSRKLYALDAKSGDIIWETDKDIFGTWLSYSQDHDLLVQAGAGGKDRAHDDVDAGIIVYQAKSGKVLWQDLESAYSGPVMLWHDSLIPNGYGGYGIELLTGKTQAWRWRRGYGCNTALAGENIMTFRSATAGFYDLANKSGTGNWGGAKSGCTASLIMADGVISSPDYTRTCICSFQIQASLALVHTPDAEVWTYAGHTDEHTQIGYNFGAPGDRLSDDKTFWRDFPAIGAPVQLNNRETDVTVVGDSAQYFRSHALKIKGPGLTWVGASGVIGLSKITIRHPKSVKEIRLYFAEPDSNAKPGQRIETLSLNGKEILKDFDVVAEAGAARKVIVKTFPCLVEAVRLPPKPAEEPPVDDPNAHPTGHDTPEPRLYEAVIEIDLIATKGKSLICGVEIIEK